MKNIMFTLCFLSLSLLTAQTEEEQLTETLNRYLQGSSYSFPKLIDSAFYEDATLFLSKKDQEIYALSPKEYSDLFKKKGTGKIQWPLWEDSSY